MKALALSRYAKAPHAAAAEMLLATLTLGSLEEFWGLAVVLRAKLTPKERQRLAWAALMACNDGEVEDIAKAVLPPESTAGWPVVPFDDVVGEASLWADDASPAELRAYAGVCLSRLSQLEERAA